MNELISPDYPELSGLLDLALCTIHTVFNAFGKGIEQYSKEIDQLHRDLHSLLKYNGARLEDLKELQIEMDLKCTVFQQHGEVY